MTNRWRGVTKVTGPKIADYQYSNNIGGPQAEETEIRSTLFNCVKHSHSLYYVERCAALAVALALCCFENHATKKQHTLTSPTTLM